MKKNSHTILPPTNQADAVLNQANPVSGTPYAVLPTTRNVRIIGIAASVTFTVQPTPLEVHVTVDGQTWRFFIDNPPTAAWHYARIEASVAENAMRLVATAIPEKAFMFEARSVAITAETTGGTVSNLSARVKYARW